MFFKINFLKKILSGISSECHTVWTLITPDDSSGLIWVQTVCQGYQQTTLVDKELKMQALKKQYDLLPGVFSMVKEVSHVQSNLCKATI